MPEGKPIFRVKKLPRPTFKPNVPAATTPQARYSPTVLKADVRVNQHGRILFPCDGVLTGMCVFVEGLERDEQVEVEVTFATDTSESKQRISFAAGFSPIPGKIPVCKGQVLTVGVEHAHAGVKALFSAVLMIKETSDAVRLEKYEVGVPSVQPSIGQASLPAYIQEEGFGSTAPATGD